MIDFPILYKYSTKDQPQQWQIFVEDDSYYTVEGVVGGKLTTSLPTKCLGKNVGKKNETTDAQQALVEAKAKMKKKIDKGYALTLEDSGAKFFEPMLAETFNPDKIDFQYKTYVQPKLDGLRVINKDGALTSRNGKVYVACPHLHQDEVILDGELYNHSLKDDFNKIVSLCKKQKPDMFDLEESKEKVEMWIYDFPDIDNVFSKRYEALKALFDLWDDFGLKHSYKLVPTFEVTSVEEIQKYHVDFLAQGFEGTIIRQDLGDYENKRSKQLLKYKDFIDEEFVIVGSEEGTGNRIGTIGFFILKHDKIEGQTFKSNVKGNFEELAEIWKNRESYIGTEATVKYFNRTPKTEEGGDIPRFGYVIKLNRKSFE